MRRTLWFTAVATVWSVFVLGCGGSSSMSGGVAEQSVTTGTLFDSRNSKMYRTVTIGGSTWMAENLNYQTGNSWGYDDDYKNAMCGRLYDWKTSMEACPPGWHLSTRQEWEALVEIAGGRTVAGKNLKSRDMWNGKDIYGFSAQPCGAYDKNYGIVQFGKRGIWGMDTERGLVDMENIAGGSTIADIREIDDNSVTRVGRSVRCVQGTKTAPASARDFDNDY